MFILFICSFAFGEVGCGYRVDSPITGGTSGIAISVTPKTDTLAQAGVLTLVSSVTGWKQDSTVSWSIVGSGVGTLTSTGSIATFTAPSTLVQSPLIVSVMARSHEDTSRVAFATITIRKQVDTTTHLQLIIAPWTVTLQVGRTQQFTSTVSGSSNNGVTWSLVSGYGSISSTGLYTAPSSIAGSSAQDIIRATAMEDTNVSAQATITILSAADTTPCFSRDVQPIITSNCGMSGCHNGGAQKSLLTYAGVRNYVTPGSAIGSKLYKDVSGAGKRMPPTPRTALTKDQIALIGRWINAGALNTTCVVDTTGGCDTSLVLYSAFVHITLQNNCLGCHAGLNPSGGVDLSTYSSVQTVANDGRLVGSLLGTAPNFIMPQNGGPLDACTIAKIRAWVNHGAANN